MLLRAALATLVLCGALAASAGACDWDPTGVCGGTRWSGWSTTAKLAVIAGGAFGLIGGAYAWLIADRSTRGLQWLRAATALACVIGAAAVSVGQEYVNWPHGRPADVPASAPR